MTLDQSGLEQVLERIRLARNFDFGNYKRATLSRRVERRMEDRRCADVQDYLAVLDREPDEFDALVSRMLIKVTAFFRDEEIWNELSQRIVPAILANKRPEEEVRIWCAGCATGEEVFSIAMLVAEALGPAFATSPLKVFGTDVDEAAIAFARRGVYSAKQVESVPKAMLDRWFVSAAEGHALRKEIRRVVVFGVNNLVSDAPISRLDLVMCRNVFIYLDAALQRRVLTRFHYALRREGILVLGRSEMIPFAGSIFETEDLPRRIYRKDGHRELPRTTQDRLVGLLTQEEVARTAGENNDEAGLLRQFYRDVVDAIALPLIVTAIDGTVTVWNQCAARMWGRAEHEVLGKRLAALGLTGLTSELLLEKSTLVREGKSERESAEGTVALPARHGVTEVTVEVTPLRGANKTVTGLVYAVQDCTAMRTLETEMRRVTEEGRNVSARLLSSNERLRSSNEELETTNEELQSANEELQTTNEELQSTNEELETTNEELQSANAELDATNRELAHRTEQMNLLALYQRTLIRSLSAGVAVLDTHGVITAWNLALERLLGIPESEAVGNELWALRIPALQRSLVTRIRRSLADRRSLRVDDTTYELPTGGTGRASVAAVPLVDEDTMVGAVVIFEDLTRAMALVDENRSLKRGRAKSDGALATKLAALPRPQPGTRGRSDG